VAIRVNPWLRQRLGWLNGDDAAGEALADEVVGFAFEAEGEAGGEKRAERLPGDAGEGDGDRVVGEALRADAVQQGVREFRADRAVGVPNCP